MIQALKCNVCGGNVEVNPNKEIGVCEYCGSTLVFPKIKTDQRIDKFNRGMYFRNIGEFDKALEIYEKLIEEDSTDAEAHWCAALCRFGIEYVEDPVSKEWTPTCHRLSYDEFMQDIDYLEAIKYSSEEMNKEYQKKAIRISDIQQGILATSKKEQAFDIFICYKESEEDGSRTQDSVIAQEIYYQLSEKGYRVFFSRITLEDKVGKEYEPYIFSALNSAKIMIVLGTTPSHLNAVWVKNEWSRFLALMKKDKNRVLLPCYRDMSPYDMPNVLSSLQSYDMAKMGFMQDLVRCIQKLIPTEDMKNAGENGISIDVVNTAIEKERIHQAQSRINRANSSFKINNYKDAYDYYVDGLVSIPNNFTALYRKGICAVYMSVDNPLVQELEQGLMDTKKTCESIMNKNNVASLNDSLSNSDALCRVELLSVNEKVLSIKEVKSFCKVEIKDAKNIVDNLPATLGENIPMEEGIAFKTRLEKSGAKVNILPCSIPQKNATQPEEKESGAVNINMVQERDNDLINLIQMYITRVGEIQTALINEEACYQQARNVCAAASVMSTAVCYLSNEEIKESWLVKVVSLLDTWLTTNVKYQVTYVKTQKVKSNDMFGNTYVEKIPVEKTKMVNYKMQDNMSTLLKRARTRCIDVYDQLPSRVEREKNLLQKLEESRKLEEELKKKVDGLRLKFSNDKEEFYKNDNVSKSKKNRKNLLAIIFSFIGIMIGIILAVNQSMIFGIVIALVIIIISFVVRQKSIENMEKEIFTEELQQSQAELTEIEKNHQKAVLDKNEAEQAVKQFNLTKFK